MLIYLMEMLDQCTTFILTYKGHSDPIIYWYDGVWENGTWGSSLRDANIWENGTWKNGTWMNGVWRNGQWEEGEWKKGQWNYGYDKNGEIHEKNDSPDKWDK